MDRLTLVLWSALSASLLTYGLTKRAESPRPVPICPDRQQIWEDVGHWVVTLVQQCEAWMKPTDLDWCLEVEDDLRELEIECCYDACAGQVSDLYDELVSAELQQCFDTWPSDQLICDCVTGLMANPDLNLDDECERAISDTCAP